MTKADSSNKDIERSLSLSIKEGRWVALEFDSRKQSRVTSFWAYVQDIDPEKKVFYCDVYNDYKGTDTLENIPLPLDRILSCQVLFFTSGGVNHELIDKINADLQGFAWLHYENFDNNILRYLELCALYDGDPFVAKKGMVEGVDSSTLEKEGEIFLSDEQMHQMCKVVIEGEVQEWDSHRNELALSRISIDEGEKKYVVCYEPICFNPKRKSLRKSGKARINPSFLIEGKKHSLSAYTELNAEEFSSLLQSDFSSACSVLREGLRRREQLNTRPEFFCLGREYSVSFSNLFSLIEKKWGENCLNAPLRAFFGNVSFADNGKSKPGIVFFDDRVNADQAYVAYSALKNKVTYVQGPPGTGKTSTIYNVLLSCFFNNKSVLVSTSNNRPLDGIASKMVFYFKGEKILFPYLRLGNQTVMAKAMDSLREAFQTNEKPFLKLGELENLRKKVLSKNKGAVDALTSYLQRASILENLSFLEKAYELDGKKKILDAQKNKLEKKLKNFPSLTEEQLIANFVSLSRDEDALYFLQQASLSRLAKLSSPAYLELREIVFSKEPNALSKFNSYLRNDNNLALLNEVFPIVFSTNLSSEKLGTSNYLFDLVIMDEAGQSSIANALLPISRGKALLLVGDEDQLLPVVNLDASLEEKFRSELGVSEDYDCLSNSILSAMKKADKVSNRILLRSHYRCGRKIISFSNERFYNNRLRVSPSLKDGEVAFFPSLGNVKTPKRNQNFQEAVNVVSYVKKAREKDLAIITPFVNQAALINTLLEKEGIHDVKAATVHSVQGDEKKAVVISTGISPYTSKRTLDWLNSHGEIANVAVSRAKEKLVVFGDEDSLKKASTGDSVWNSLFEYCKSKGTVEVVPSEFKNASIGLSNSSPNEDEFYLTLSQILSTKGKLSIKRNVPLVSILGKEVQSKQEFDSVLYAKTSFSSPKPLFAFEFDGGEHYTDAKRMSLDKKKEELCLRAGLRIVRIANSFSKDYEFLKSLIEAYSKDDASAEQLSLF